MFAMRSVRACRLLTIGVFVGWSTLSFAETAPVRAFTVDDLVRLDRIDNPRLSPDGKRIAFTVRETDMDANKGVVGIWLTTREGSTPKRLTMAGVTSGSPQWSRDGRWLYFLSERGGGNQVWRLRIDGGEAERVTGTPLDIDSFKLSPDGKKLALSMQVFIDCADLECTQKRLDERKKSKASGVIYDTLFVRHWDTWADGRRNQLFVVNLDNQGRAGTPVRVSQGIDGDIPSKPFGGDEEYAWSPDSKALVFSVRAAGKEEAWSTNFDLYRAPADGGAAPVNLTAANLAWDSAPVFSPNGRTLYYLAMKRPGFEADRFGIMAMDIASGKAREIAPRWDRSASGLAISADGKALLTTADDTGNRALFAIDTGSGRVRKLASDGTVGGFDVAGGAIVFARDTLTSPADLYAVSIRGGSTRRLTQFNANRLAGVNFGAFEQFSFAGANGDTVYGYIVKPWNYREGERYPVAFLIHGGPQGSFGNHFHYRWNPQTYAGQGFASVMIDFHGSTGYGQAFTDAISGDWGGKPLEDLQKGYAAALEKFPFLDADRACALGASYGGYMINWIAGHWQKPWKCLVNHDGVFDNRAMYYSTEELWFAEWETGGPQYQVPNNYEAYNPVNRVADWNVPMLVVQGELDYRIPVTQGLSTFTALQRRGIPSKFLYFPNENHWVLKPHNSVLWHNTVNAWLQRWTK